MSNVSTFRYVPTVYNNPAAADDGEEAGAEEEIVGELPMLRKDNETGKIGIETKHNLIDNPDSREIGTRNSRVTLMARPQCIPIAAEEDEKIGNDSRVSFLVQSPFFVSGSPFSNFKLEPKPLLMGLIRVSQFEQKEMKEKGLEL